MITQPRQPVVHKLKCDPVSFKEIWDGRKTADFRRDDRNFMAGDRVVQQEVVEDDKLTGREVLQEITHVVRGPDYQVPNKFAVLSVRTIELTEEAFDREPEDSLSGPEVSL